MNRPLRLTNSPDDIGLYALPGAEAFYRRYNMPDYGPDPDKDGLVDFEYAALTL